MYVGIIMLKGMLKCLLCKKGVWQSFMTNNKGEIVVFATVSQAAAVISQGTPWFCVNFMVTSKLKRCHGSLPRNAWKNTLQTRCDTSFSELQCILIYRFCYFGQSQACFFQSFLTKQCSEMSIYPLIFFFFTCFLLFFNKASVKGPNFSPLDR